MCTGETQVGIIFVQHIIKTVDSDTKAVGVLILYYYSWGVKVE